MDVQSPELFRAAQTRAASASDDNPDICPSYPWWWHHLGSKQDWATSNVVLAGREVFAGLAMIDLAAKMNDRVAAQALARSGAAHVAKHASELNRQLA